MMALIDYVPRAFVRVKKPVKNQIGYTRIPHYLIMPTVYGNISYLQNIDFLKRYADKVVICTSKYESKAFYRDLEAVCQQYGFRYVRAELPFAGGKPIKNAYTIYRGIFQDPSILDVPHDTLCLLMDADTYAPQNINNLMRTFIRENIDIASLRCEVANPRTVIEHLQAFEYRLAMDNRRMDPWLTSGACNIAKVHVFQRIFRNHSKFFAGGDIEIGKLAQVMGYKVKHIDFTFYTAAPNTFKDWFNQRIIWFAGGIRHHVTNVGSYGWLHFFMLFYNSLLVYLLMPLRWIEIINFPLTMLALIALSWVYTAVLVSGKGWRPLYLLLPFYSFVQSMIIIPLALIRYLKLSWAHRSLGMLRYDLTGIGRSMRMVYKTLNLSSAAIVIYAAITFTSARLDYWSQHGTVLRWLFQ